MPNPPVLFPPSDQFWTQCARHLISRKDAAHAALDFSALRIIVPAFEHAQWLSQAMAEQLGTHFIPPRFNTMSAWLALQPPDLVARVPVSDGERIMALYAQLREHGWLKKLFTARKNTDLLPLAQTLITLSDELTLALLPLAAQGGQLLAVWQQALAQMPTPAQQLLSDEAQLVWQIWQSQLDGQDKISLRFEQMIQLAQHAPDALIWISPVLPEGLDLQFLTTYAQKQQVQVISLDWCSTALEPAFAQAWQEIFETQGDAGSVVSAPPRNQIRLLEAASLEQEAQRGAQAIIGWLQQGKSSIALIAQDRVVARRIRALLERAHIHVADETGWKLSTTRAASALAAWFDVIVTRADTVMLLDLIKSPYFSPEDLAGFEAKSDWVMSIELTLLRANLVGGWDNIIRALEKTPECAALCGQLKRHATQYFQRKTLIEWLTLTRQFLTEFGIAANWEKDEAGAQVAQLLEQLRSDLAALTETFSFAEWRVFINLQLEESAFESGKQDQRVVMLPLNGARLRRFDAILMVGCDASHLPSQPQEVLFFSNAVRGECGLITREQRQQQQLRDFAELLASNPVIVLSWQAQQRGEDNPVSPWIERLNLGLQQAGLERLPDYPLHSETQTLRVITPQQPAPEAAALLPATLSASAYNRLIACPYQFFATRMLGLASLDTLSDMPEKRDYGGWLHAILKIFHDTLKQQPQLVSIEQQQALLTSISQTEFDHIIKASPAALGLSKKWEKVIPAYVEWSHAYTQSGWQFEMGEVWLEKNLVWNSSGQESSGQVLLRGQIDRIDISQTGEFAVLDYKTNLVTALNKKIQLAEDQQLPFYGLLAESDHRHIAVAHYVALEKTRDKIDQVGAPDYQAWKQELEASIISNMTAISQGAALPAQGTSSVCQYCEVRGLCRKGAW